MGSGSRLDTPTSSERTSLTDRLLVIVAIIAVFIAGSCPPPRSLMETNL